MNAEKRPNPDDILSAVEAEEKNARRGALKIFFGSSAGVGKTYAMVQAARSQISQGVDVVVGIVETHGRHETQSILEGLAFIPQRNLHHKGVLLREFDLDAALARKPELILVDELAHTNIPGSRHAKRWQDVMELLNAGIDVYTSLNVQHLESANDIVSNITGVNIHETIPDSIFDEADEIQLVDIPTEELLERLRTGKVYVAEGAAERAAQNFFNKTNLMSLRELALRRTAEHVDADTDYERIQAGLFTPNIAGERVLVCVGADNLAVRLVRTGRRVSRSLKAPWYVVTVDTGDQDAEGREYKHLKRALQIAQQNEASVITLQKDRVGEAILDFARSKGITKIIIGKNIHSRWQDWLFGSTVEYIIRHSGNIDVYIITGTTSRRLKASAWFRETVRLRNYFFALLASGFCTLVSYLLEPFFEPIDIIMVYLMGVVLVASRLGRYPSLFYSFLSVSCFNFFFVVPIHSFTVADSSYWLTFLVMLLTSIVISSQAGMLRTKTLHSRRRERVTQTFYALTREMAAKRERGELTALTLKHMRESLEGEILLWLQAESGSFDIEGGRSAGDRLREESIVTWAIENKQPSGIGTDTLPGASAYYEPIIGTVRTYGCIAYRPREEGASPTVTEREALETFASLLASSLDRVYASAKAEELRIEREAEALKNTFLNSMSHDLRTPMATIRGSAETLMQSGKKMPEETKHNLLKIIYTQADRLTRVMNNLLDLTRLETGKIKISSESYYLQELIGSALSVHRESLSKLTVSIDIPSDLPMISVDGLLFEQVFQNLLENAASFAPAGSTLSIRAKLSSKGIVMTFSDEGSGIPEGMEQRIFDKFYTMGHGDRHKGAGLGLAICKAIVMAHEGRIWVEKKMSGDNAKGATFYIFIPASRLVVPDLSKEPM